MNEPFFTHKSTTTPFYSLVAPATGRKQNFFAPALFVFLLALTGTIVGKLSPFVFSAESIVLLDLGTTYFTSILQPFYPSLYLDTYYNDYAKIIITFIVAGALCFLLFILSFFFSFANQKEYEKTSEYECGFEPFDSATRQPYDVHFYMVGILFMVFDVEVALLFPWAANLSAVNSTGFWSVILFLAILTVGFVYE
jgi:NADH-quinone oxidoreductase subunit A